MQVGMVWALAKGALQLSEVAMSSSWKGRKEYRQEQRRVQVSYFLTWCWSVRGKCLKSDCVWIVSDLICSPSAFGIKQRQVRITVRYW